MTPSAGRGGRPAGRPGSSPAGRTGWPPVVACFCVAVFTWSFGFYGQGVFLAELQRGNGWSTGLIAAATTTFYLVGAVFMAFVPEVIERVGARPAILAGIACLGGSALALPAVQSPAVLFALNIAMGLGWALTSGTAITTTLAPWFQRRRGLAISLALNGASAAGFTVVPVMIRLNQSLGFAAGTRLVAITLALLVGAIVVLMVRRPATAWLEAERGAGPRPSRRTGAPLDAPAPRSRAEALAGGRFWLAAMPFSLGLMAQVGFIVHQVAFLLPQLGPTGTGLAVALMTVSALVGRIGVGFLVDRIDCRLAAAASFASQAAALAAMLLVPEPWVLYSGSLVFGFSVGNAITLPALVVMDEFAAASFGLVVGLVTALNQFVYAFGPVTLGLLHDWTGGYAVPLALCIALQLAASGLALAGRPRRSG